MTTQYVFRSEKANGNVAWVKDLGYCIISLVFDGVSDPIPWKAVAHSIKGDYVRDTELAFWDDYGQRHDVWAWDWLDSSTVEWLEQRPDSGLTPEVFKQLKGWLDDNYCTCVIRNVERYLPEHPDHFNDFEEINDIEEIAV